MKNPNRGNELGFTFIELIMVLGVLVLLFGFTITVTKSTRAAQDTAESIIETGEIIESSVNLRRFTSDFDTISDTSVINFSGLPDSLVSTGTFLFKNGATGTITNSLGLLVIYRPGFKLTVTIDSKKCNDYVLGLSSLEFYLRRIEVNTTLVFDSSTLTTINPLSVTTACGSYGATKDIKILIKGT